MGFILLSCIHRALHKARLLLTAGTRCSLRLCLFVQRQIWIVDEGSRRREGQRESRKRMFAVLYCEYCLCIYGIMWNVMLGLRSPRWNFLTLRVWSVLLRLSRARYVTLYSPRVFGLHSYMCRQLIPPYIDTRPKHPPHTHTHTHTLLKPPFK